MDKFVSTVGTGSGISTSGSPCGAGEVMSYYDGNAVTGLWNYAQHFAMSDNSFGTTFGPSSPGAVNLASGNTGNVDMTHTVNNPSIATAATPNADLTPRRARWVFADQRRAAVLGRLLHPGRGRDERPEHR